ncbi:Globin-like protein [Leptotrombidium deliense]|uniref:Globin-like protein n=1 Tax=Leptotrombidium deliense TaxID=299467 RepID=A0A443SKI8_9ACAR|nr:Globin-like protein [Leptotrombidium deliense]
MSLTEKQRSVIHDTWKSMQQSRKAWNDLLISLFAKHTEYQKLFKGFANVPLDQLRDNKRLTTQMAAVVAVISACIECLHDENALIDMLKGLALRHYHRNVTIQMFENMGVVFISWLVDTLGSQTMDEEAIAAWGLFYTTFVSIIKRYYEEFDNKNANNI